MTRRSRSETAYAAAALLVVAGAAGWGAVSLDAARQPAEQPSFSRETLDRRLPATRLESYAVNVRIRPLLLFWIGRDDVGEATVTWREGPNQQKAYEFLIGSDPARVPRKINRWGFIVEELRGDEADILGIMKESGEQSLDEAKAKVEREGTTSTFKAARTHIAGHRAQSGVITLQAPSHLTYRDVDEVLALVPATPPDQKTIDLPPGTKRGFLVALETLLQSSILPCSTEGSRAKEVPVVRYLYNRDLFDLSVDACTVKREYETGNQTFDNVIDGRFHLKNLTTRNAMTFHVAYGTSGDLRGIPVRMMFRPRWWMEIELELHRSSAARLTSIAHQGSDRLVDR